MASTGVCRTAYSPQIAMPIHVVITIHRLRTLVGKTAPDDIEAAEHEGKLVLANRFPEAYEKYLAFRFPAMNIRATLEVV